VEVQAGNLFGDEVKGRNYENFPADIKKGLLQHRFIDSYTDSHPINLEVKKMLYPYFGKYAGIALDIYYDHYLAIKWLEYSRVPLIDFSLEIYRNMKPLSLMFSDKAVKMLNYMEEYNWLYNYKEMEGMEKTFTGMSKRLGKNSGMENAYQVLEKHYAKIEEGFNDYFPDLLRKSSDKLLDL